MRVCTLPSLAAVLLLRSAHAAPEAARWDAGWGSTDYVKALLGLLAAQPSVLAELTQRWRYVLADEPAGAEAEAEAQAAFVQMLVGPDAAAGGRQLFVAGASCQPDSHIHSSQGRQRFKRAPAVETLCRTLCMPCVASGRPVAAC